MPLYLAQVRGIDNETMSWLMGSLGVAAAIYSFGVSGLSDVIGRKPVMVVLPFLSLVGPLAAMYFTGSPFVMAALFFVGWAVNGTFPIFMATIPSETVDARHHATVLGLAMGACEILGGVFGPPVAGLLNDSFGPLELPVAANGAGRAERHRRAGARRDGTESVRQARAVIR